MGDQGVIKLPRMVISTRWNVFTGSYSQRLNVGRTITESGRRDPQGACNPSVLRKAHHEMTRNVLEGLRNEVV